MVVAFRRNSNIVVGRNNTCNTHVQVLLEPEIAAFPAFAITLHECRNPNDVWQSCNNDVRVCLRGIHTTVWRVRQGLTRHTKCPYAHGCTWTCAHVHVPPPLHDGRNPQMAHATFTSPAAAGGIFPCTSKELAFVGSGNQSLVVISCMCP